MLLFEWMLFSLPRAQEGKALDTQEHTMLGSMAQKTPACPTSLSIREMGVQVAPSSLGDCCQSRRSIVTLGVDAKVDTYSQQAAVHISPL